MGVGCNEYGVCYADAHGKPEMCGLPEISNREQIIVNHLAKPALKGETREVCGTTWICTDPDIPRWISISKDYGRKFEDKPSSVPVF